MSRNKGKTYIDIRIRAVSEFFRKRINSATALKGLKEKKKIVTSQQQKWRLYKKKHTHTSPSQINV